MYQTFPDKISFQFIYSEVIFNLKQNNVTIYFQEHVAFLNYAHDFFLMISHKSCAKTFISFISFKSKNLQNKINTNHLLHQSLIK